MIAFLVGGGMATEAEGLGRYFELTSAASVVLTVGTFLKFEEKPPVPPSSSKTEKLVRGDEEPSFLESVKFF